MTRAVRNVTAVIEEVAQHLSGLLGTRVEITMEIHAELPEGTPDHIVRKLISKYITGQAGVVRAKLEAGRHHVVIVLRPERFLTTGFFPV